MLRDELRLKSITYVKPLVGYRMKRLVIFLIVCFPFIGYTQPVQFTEASIPIVANQVVFKVEFKYNLTKEEFHKRAYSYLNSLLNPYSGHFIVDNKDSTVSRIIDYLDIDANMVQTFGMYMTYNLKLEYKNGLCTMFLRNIRYMEKQYFETQEKSQRKLDMPEYTGKDIMIDKNYSVLFKRKASEKVTEASLVRINEIIKNLDASFAQK